MKTLHLVLNSHWFNRHLKDKNEDYRTITPYWAKRFCTNYEYSGCKDRTPPGMATLCRKCERFVPKQYTDVVLRYGYTSASVRKEFLTTEIGLGILELGASKELSFIVKCGKTLEINK